MMNCCIARKKAREENAHRFQSIEVDDVEETGSFIAAIQIVGWLSHPRACDCTVKLQTLSLSLVLFRIRGGGILRVHERRPDRSAERGSPINEDAAQGKAPAVEQTGGQIGQTPFAQVGCPARVAVAELRDA